MKQRQNFQDRMRGGERRENIKGRLLKADKDSALQLTDRRCGAAVASKTEQ